jgi:hypothetical protein
MEHLPKDEAGGSRRTLLSCRTCLSEWRIAKANKMLLRAGADPKDVRKFLTSLDPQIAEAGKPDNKVLPRADPIGRSPRRQARQTRCWLGQLQRRSSETGWCLSSRLQNSIAL